jgi:hypothetical protein
MTWGDRRWYVERDEAIVAAYVSGVHQENLGREHDLTVQRIRQILRKAGVIVSVRHDPVDVISRQAMVLALRASGVRQVVVARIIARTPERVRQIQAAAESRLRHERWYRERFTYIGLVGRAISREGTDE